MLKDEPVWKRSAGSTRVAILAAVAAVALVAAVFVILWWPEPEAPTSPASVAGDTPPAPSEAPVVIEAEPAPPTSPTPPAEPPPAEIATAPAPVEPAPMPEPDVAALPSEPPSTPDLTTTELPPPLPETVPPITDLGPTPTPSTAVDEEAGRQELVTAMSAAGLARPEWVANVRTPAPGADLLRLDRPEDGGECPSPPCYEGVAQNRLREGERIVLAFDVPPDNPYVVVDYFMADGNVAHLYPSPSPDANAIEAEAYVKARNGGATLWVGDRRAGPVFDELTIGAPFGRELFLAVAAPQPLFTAPRPGVEPAADYQDALARALASQPGQAVADSIPLETSGP